MAQNQSEIIIRRMNLFLNSEDRKNDVQGADQSTGQSISVPLQGLNIVAEDNQFIRLKLQSFCCNNNFDNHAAADQRAFLFMGSDTIPKAADGDALPSAALNHNYLTLSAYNTYADVMADATDMVASLFQQNGYTTADWDYVFTEMRGTGNAIANPLFTTSPADQPTNGGYDSIGYYRQNGVKCLLGEFTMSQNKQLFWGDASSGLNYPPGSSGGGSSGTCFNNTAVDTSFYLTAAQSSDIYLLLGGRKQPFSSADLSSLAAFTAAGIPTGSTAADSSKQLLNVTCTFVTTGTGASTKTVITVKVATVFRMQLQVENQLYLRSNLLSTNYATDNYNQSNGVQNSRELSASNIFACFKMNSNIIYYEDSGEDTWLLDIAQRNIPNLELFLTNRHGNPLTLDNPVPDFQQPYNVSFQCCIRVEIVERSVVQSTNAQRDPAGYANARYSGNVMTTVRQGQDLARNSVFTKLATRELR
jgi:hypothetical protein